MTSSESKLLGANYAAAIIDILGQKKLLLKYGMVPCLDDPAGKSNFLQHLRDTLGVVDDLEVFIDRWYQKYLKLARKLSVPPGTETVYSRLLDPKIRFQRFGDTMLVFCPMAVTPGEPRVSGVLALLCACGMACVRNLAGKHPLRGGVDLGWGNRIPAG